MRGKFSFLGTGASAGVPVIGYKCAVCTSPSKKNQQLRPSGLLKVGGKEILIDIGPDFRSQAIAFGIDPIQILSGVRIAPKVGYRPLLAPLDAKTWVFTGLGSRGLLYHALLAKEWAQVVKNSVTA